MRVLVLGSNGFIGREVVDVLSEEHDVYTGSREAGDSDHQYKVDLADPETIRNALETIHPDVVVQCAGIVENTEAAKQNPVFTRNLLEVISEQKTMPKSVVVLGSAAEYGVVDDPSVPVTEDARLHAESLYGKSKIEESTIALEYRDKAGVPVTIARIFNPIGPGMHSRFLVPRMLNQITELEKGARDSLEISRLDSERDYAHVRDIARGIAKLATNAPKEAVYNIGSGVRTTNGQLLKLILERKGISEQPKVTETMEQPEPNYAAQADITRIREEFDWKPEMTLGETVKEIIDATER